MGESYIKRFAEWQNYVHYLLLTMGLFIWHGLSITSNLEQQFVNTLLGIDKWILLGEMFFWYMLGFIIIDSIIHAVFWFAPEPIQWRD
jgi:hypothetical protein